MVAQPHATANLIENCGEHAAMMGTEAVICSIVIIKSLIYIPHISAPIRMDGWPRSSGSGSERLSDQSRQSTPHAACRKHMQLHSVDSLTQSPHVGALLLDRTLAVAAPPLVGVGHVSKPWDNGMLSSRGPTATARPFVDPRLHQEEHTEQNRTEQNRTEQYKNINC